MMNRLLIVLLLIVACGVGLGFYLGWFGVTSDSADGKSHFTFTVDKDKVQEDENKVLTKMHDVGHKVKDKATAPTGNAKDQVTPPVQPPQDQE
jgi:hypothetical protein